MTCTVSHMLRQDPEGVGQPRNIRTSNSNGYGFPNLIFEQSRCAGFNNTFHSPRIAADGTSSATLGPALIHSSPKRCKDSSLFSRQCAGRIFGSSILISSASGISPSIDTRSLGLRFGSRFAKVSTAATASKVEAYTTRPPRLFQRPPDPRAPPPPAV